jgi:hypothetical protein
MIFSRTADKRKRIGRQDVSIVYGNDISGNPERFRAAHGLSPERRGRRVTHTTNTLRSHTRPVERWSGLDVPSTLLGDYPVTEGD